MQTFIEMVRVHVFIALLLAVSLVLVHRYCRYHMTGIFAMPEHVITVIAFMVISIATKPHSIIIIIIIVTTFFVTVMSFVTRRSGSCPR